MQKKPMYQYLAQYYDRIYSWKNYKSESTKIKALIKKYKKSPGNNLLEAACGTGKHTQYFKDIFSVQAFDINQAMLNIARKNVKKVVFKRQDMTNFKLNQKFDVVLCLFSSIGYLRTYKNLAKTIKNFSDHLNVGGIVIIEPWLTKSNYLLGSTGMKNYSDDNINIALLSVSKKRGHLSIIDMNYLIAEKNKSVKHFVEHHELAMFEIDKILKIMQECGLKAKFIKNGLMPKRGLYIGIKT